MNNSEVLEQTAQGAGGDTVPGGVQETWRCDTWRQLQDMV